MFNLVCATLMFGRIDARIKIRDTDRRRKDYSIIHWCSATVQNMGEKTER